MLTQGGALRELVAAGQWIVLVAPASFGFWLVSGDLSGVPASGERLLIAGALVALALASLAQVVLGYRLPIFEGPASAYLAALAVIAGSGDHGPQAVTGGLLVGGGIGLVLGLAGADRWLNRLFTPLVSTVFLLVVSLMILPPAAVRAIGSTDPDPLGTGPAWASLAAVLIVGVGLRLVPPLRALSPLIALVCGMGAFLLAGGTAGLQLGGGVRPPEPLPWGAPTFPLEVLLPSAIAAALVAFNLVGSVQVMARAFGLRDASSRTRRGLIVHGATQATGALAGNMLGNVPRMDSLAAVELIQHRGRAALGIAAVALIALASWSPFVDLVAALPLPVSAAIVLLVLGMLLVTGIRETVALSPSLRRTVVAPALVPVLIWIPLSGEMPPVAQLVANPLLWGIVIAIVAERLAARRARAVA